MRLQLVAAALVALLAGTPVSADETAGYAGRPLIDVLTELQTLGLQLVYSSAVVTPEMMVRQEPTSGEPREILDEILEPHGLKAEGGPGGTVLIVAASPTSRQTSSGELRGTITVAGGPPPARRAQVAVEGTSIRAATGADGSFLLRQVPAGTYTVTGTSPGCVPRSITKVEIRPGDRHTLNFDLLPRSVFLSEVVVTPSHFRLLGKRPETHQFLDREDVRRMPNVADDLYRAVKRLPGATGGDFTAKINVRGGDQDELLVVLDGLELYEPFHLKDFQNVFSIIDSEAVGGVDFLTGGFPVEYGDRMSGVMDISVVTPAGPSTTAVELGTLNARLLTQGPFSAGRGRYLVSARAWYPDVIIRSVEDTSVDVVTDYYDLLARAEYELDGRSQIAANLLVAYDDLGYRQADQTELEDVRAEYGSYHGWLNLRTGWSERVFSQTVASAGRLTRRRVGSVEDVEDGALDVDDNRSFEFTGLGQDWSIALGDRNLLKLGFDVIRQEAVYDYVSSTTLVDPDSPTDPLPPVTEVNTHLEPSGTSFSLYAADRLQLADPLIVEFGLRWDRQSWVGEHQLSPRVNLRYAVTDATTLRAAWGRFYQSQRLNELQVEDGVQSYYPAQLARHWLISFEHGFANGVAGRLEIFRKDLSDLHPRYENLFSPIHLFPEAEADRIEVAPERGLVRGVEVVAKGRSGRAVTWWASYVLSRAEDRIDGTWQPRSWDQTHAGTFGLNLALPHQWTIGAVVLAHSGWPTTPVTGMLVVDEDGQAAVEPVVGLRNSDRYPSYFRVDFRISKLFETEYGDLTVFLEVLNATDRDNICCTEDIGFVVEPDGTITTVPELRSWAPIVPSLAINWRF